MVKINQWLGVSSWAVLNRVACLLLTVGVAGCASRPPGPQSPPPAAPAPPATAPAPVAELERHHVELGAGISVDYQIQRKISSANKVSCYAFITGTLNNFSGQGLGRRSVLDFNFFSGGRQIFRDLTSPVGDVPAGSRVQFEMVVSPVHKEGCIRYEPIVVTLRKVLPARAD